MRLPYFVFKNTSTIFWANYDPTILLPIDITLHPYYRAFLAVVSSIHWIHPTFGNLFATIEIPIPEPQNKMQSDYLSFINYLIAHWANYG